jgi:hypothetical protein
MLPWVAALLELSIAIESSKPSNPNVPAEGAVLGTVT